MQIKYKVGYYHEIVKSATGDGYEKKYKVEYDEKGARHLVVCGKNNVYKKIQSFAEDTNIYKILSRYFGGDVSALDKNKGFYADVREIPSNFNDFHNKVVAADNIWNGLATDFKEMFGNDKNRFLSDIYDKSFESKYNDYLINKQKGVRYDSVSNNRYNTSDVNIRKSDSNFSNVNPSVEEVGGNSNE